MVQHEGVYLWSFQDLHDLERALESLTSSPTTAGESIAPSGGKTPWEIYRPRDPVPWKETA